MNNLEAMPDISLDGFQVVGAEMFMYPSKTSAPTCTIWDNCIGFCKQDVLLLNGCENILIQVNAARKCLLVVPSTSKDKDSLKWSRTKQDKIEARKIMCPRFSEQLYKQWGWDTDYVYRTNGRLVTAGTKVMLLFDFSDAEHWLSPEAKKDAK